MPSRRFEAYRVLRIHLSKLEYREYRGVSSSIRAAGLQTVKLHGVESPRRSIEEKLADNTVKV